MQEEVGSSEVLIDVPEATVPKVGTSGPSEEPNDYRLSSGRRSVPKQSSSPQAGDRLLPETTPAPVVETESGPVRGFWRPGSAAFLGIPFAEAPVGELRFAAPLPAKPWTGVRDALCYGPTPQRRPLAETTTIPEPSIPGSHTLNVNVFTPAPADTSAELPVLVWIHGGGYLGGSPASPWYDGRAFNRDGIVTVTVSYRLGFDGFGWISDAPHNRGVLDWILALEWVRDNIRAFGGDPSRVTIAGQSAGGGAALTLLSVPRAQALFARVISLSGPPTEVTLEQSEATGRRLARLGGVQSTRAGLAALTEQRVLELQAQVSSIGQEQESADPLSGLTALLGKGLVLGPVVDGDLIPRSTIEALRAGHGADKALLLGATDHEFNMMLAGAEDQLPPVPEPSILARLGVSPETAESYAAGHAGLGTAQLLGQFATDRMFRAPALHLAQARATSTAGTWLYRFGWQSPITGHSGHCLDVPFFFDVLEAEGVHAITGSVPPQSLAADVHGAAVAFIRDAQPGWTAWEDNARQTRLYDVPSSDIEDGYADVWMLEPTPVAG